jgi:hypothetical protein
VESGEATLLVLVLECRLDCCDSTRIGLLEKKQTDFVSTRWEDSSFFLNSNPSSMLNSFLN